MIRSFMIQHTYAIGVLLIFIAYRTWHLECHIDTIVAVSDGYNAWQVRFLIWMCPFDSVVSLGVEIDN